MPITIGVRALLATAILVPGGAAVAAMPTQVRVVNGPARIQVSCCAPAGVLLEVAEGTTLDVLRKDDDWFWVVLPRDGYGTRRGGWIRARDVEAVAAGEAAAAKADQGSESGALPSADASASSADDKVTLTETRAGTSSGETPTVATKTFKFEDVHFDRNRFSLRSADLDVLRAAAAALKADPTLVVTIEGHTCDLGTPAYNMALGRRRANAVKDFLVSEGIAPERLHAVSFGENDPKYDNSREETRQLNRRVAVVPNAQP